MKTADLGIEELQKSVDTLKHIHHLSKLKYFILFSSNTEKIKKVLK